MLRAAPGAFQLDPFGRDLWNILYAEVESLRRTIWSLVSFDFK
jgi:hypothetical protein